LRRCARQCACVLSVLAGDVYGSGAGGIL